MGKAGYGLEFVDTVDGSTVDTRYTVADGTLRLRVEAVPPEVAIDPCDCLRTVSQGEMFLFRVAGSARRRH
jgi:hypothetical protein